MCFVCLRSCALCSATFAAANAIDADGIGAVTIDATYETTMENWQVPTYGLNGVCRVLLCGTSGTRNLVVQWTGRVLATCTHHAEVNFR